MWTSSSALLRLPLSLLFLGALTLATLGLGGCKQDEGDRCQLDSDCSDGLICCFSVNPPPLEQRYLGGTCTSVNQCSTTQPDLGEIDDGGTTPDADEDAETPDAEPQLEAGSDTTPAADSSTVDTAPAVDSSVDTAPAADSTVDTTPAADSMVDQQ